MITIPVLYNPLRTWWLLPINNPCKNQQLVDDYALPMHKIQIEADSEHQAHFKCCHIKIKFTVFQTDEFPAI